MCDPVSLGIAATAMAAIGTGVSVYAQTQQAEYQAKVAERNAALEREAAQQEIQNTREAALAHYRRVAQLKGQQIVGAAANGVDINFGTAADVLDDTDMLAREDVSRIYQQGNQNLRSRDIGVSNSLAEAASARMAGTGALVGGMFDMGSTILGGVSQYKTLKSSGGFGTTGSKPAGGAGGDITVYRNGGYMTNWKPR